MTRHLQDAGRLADKHESGIMQQGIDFTSLPGAVGFTMSLSMHQAAVPLFTRELSNLLHVLEVGEAHATARGFDPALLVQARLTADMLPLVRQVQIACDMAMRGCAPPAFASGIA